MKFEILLLQGAQSDFQGAYERFGDRFYRIADKSLDQIARFPESAPIFHGRYRRLLLRGTPLGLFYTITGKRIMVGALLDLTQEPATIRRHLDRL